MFGWLANQNARVYIKNGSFFIKHNEYTYPKGRALMQMYRTVSQTKRGNRHCQRYQCKTS